jgi:hypothetical protein
MLGDWQSKIDLARPETGARIVKLLSSADLEVVRASAAVRQRPARQHGRGCRR